MEGFFPITARFLKPIDEQKLEEIIPGTGGYVAVANLGKQNETNDIILGCKTRDVDSCAICIKLGIADNLRCEKPKKDNPS